MTPAPSQFVDGAPSSAFINWAYDELGIPCYVESDEIMRPQHANDILIHCGAAPCDRTSDIQETLNRIQALVEAHQAITYGSGG